MINKTITLQEPITNGQARVKIGDGHWTVTGPDLPTGSKIKVVEVSGNSLVVELVK
jgi:membrane protein implicated in regulation of membrane protease activity